MAMMIDDGLVHVLRGGRPNPMTQRRAEPGQGRREVLPTHQGASLLCFRRSAFSEMGAWEFGSETWKRKVKRNGPHQGGRPIHSTSHRERLAGKTQSP